jgi:ABC-2 type transport system ATP-binding protein
MDFLVANDISKQFINHRALNSVSISVPEQSIFGLLGPNGAGKTTLIRIINQITAPDSGTVFMNGQRLRPGHVAQIGYLPEERGLYRKMKVGEQAMYLAQLKDVPRKEAHRRLKAWFKKFDIDTWWDKKVEELSKGMQQKIQFITTILHNPKLLIFDEPFSGFDPINANILKEEILKLREEGATVIFSTHNMESVEVLCDHIALIHNANKILDGEMKTIKKAYSNNTFTTRLTHLKGSLRAELHADFNILETHQADDHLQAKIHVEAPATPNDLVRNLMQIGEINSFNEVIPSMNDIFIRNVQENNLIQQS